MLLSLNQASAQAFERRLWRELRRELQKNRVKWMLFMGEKKKRLIPQMLRDQAFRRMVPVVGLEPTRYRYQRILSGYIDSVFRSNLHSTVPRKR